MSIFTKILSFFKVSDPASAPYGGADAKHRFSVIRWQVFFVTTLGYGVFYVCRLAMNVVRKPIVDEGLFNETQLGVIGSFLFFGYAIGKLTNGFLADRSNVKRFLMTGLLITASINVYLGFASWFWIFAVFMAVNGWAQSVGSPSCVVSLSRWYSDKDRGSFYGFWSASHNIGEAISLILIANVAVWFNWRYGMITAGIVGLVMFMLLWFFMKDTPQSCGFLMDKTNPQKKKDISKEYNEAQIAALKNWAIWTIALSSAFMYVSRYAVNSWGVYYLQADKGYAIDTAALMISVSSIFGILGTIFCGVISDVFFKGSRNMPCLIFGIMNTISLAAFLFIPQCGIWLDIVSMMFFGLAIGALICYLGGLMAVDYAPLKASGAALGIVGIASYLGAGFQDIISGALIERYKTVVDGVVHYDLTYVKFFWVGAALISTLLAACVWKAKHHDAEL